MRPCREGSHPTWLGAHTQAVTWDGAAGRGWGICSCFLLPSSPSSAAICLQGPGASGQAGAPDQAAITLLSADCRMMTQEDKPHIVELPTGKHSLIPSLVQHCLLTQEAAVHLREELRSSDSHWPALPHPTAQICPLCSSPTSHSLPLPGPSPPRLFPTVLAPSYSQLPPAPPEPQSLTQELRLQLA